MLIRMLIGIILTILSIGIWAVMSESDSFEDIDSFWSAFKNKCALIVMASFAGSLSLIGTGINNFEHGSISHFSDETQILSSEDNMSQMFLTTNMGFSFPYSDVHIISNDSKSPVSVLDSHDAIIGVDEIKHDNQRSLVHVSYIEQTGDEKNKIYIPHKDIAIMPTNDIHKIERNNFLSSYLMNDTRIQNNVDKNNVKIDSEKDIKDIKNMLGQ